MFNKLINEQNLNFKPLVAFSGEVIDPDTGVHYTENSLNQLPPKVKIEDAFKTPHYRIMIVAYKFQTGYDEPMLHTMYVDKKLSGVHAVQTLSRLNRTMRGKDGTMILDFVNEAEDIQKSFQDYYQTTFLEEETDPNKLHDMKAKLIDFGIFNEEDVDQFAEVFFNPAIENELLQPILDKVVNIFKYISDENTRENFRSLLQSYIRLYGYISQILTWSDIGHEKLYVFSRSLNRKLPKKVNQQPFEVQDSIDLDSFRIQKTFDELAMKLEKQDGSTPGITSGIHPTTEEEKDLLSNIIKVLKESFGMNLTEDDKIDMGRIQQKLTDDPELLAVISSDNTMENIRYKFDKIVDSLLLDFVHTKLDLYKKLTEPRANTFFKQKWFEGYVGMRR
jgi:type I restriction enzyme R subunit